MTGKLERQAVEIAEVAARAKAKALATSFARKQGLQAAVDGRRVRITGASLHRRLLHDLDLRAASGGWA